MRLPLSSDAMPTISVTVCTYKRPGLADTLRSLALQTVPPETDVDVVVVDNDATGSAEPIVNGWAAAAPFPVVYAVEASRNIAAARNKALSLARGDWIASIDDDEIADRNWLVNLLTSAETLRADVAIGRVEAIYPPQTPQFLIKADPFTRDFGPTGTVLRTGITGNAFFRRRFIATHGLVFDERFGRSGGEDSDFFSRLHTLGGKIVACREAVVSESIPPERLEPRYLRSRALRSGQSYGGQHLRALPLSRRVAFFALSAAKATAFLALAGAMTPVSRPHAWRLKSRAWLNFGKTRACLGLPLITMY